MDKTRKNRTSRLADLIVPLPDHIVTITNPRFKYALTFVANEIAYLQYNVPLTSRSGSYYLPEDSLSDPNYILEDEIPTDLEFELLHYCFSVLINYYDAQITSGTLEKMIVKVYYPQVCRKLGKTDHINARNFDHFAQSINSFANIFGVIKGMSIPALVIESINFTEYTVSFASPYLFKLVSEIHVDSIRRDSHGNIVLKTDGQPQRMTPYRSIIRATIGRCKNRRAIINVLTIVSLITNTRSKNPTIRVKELIDFNPLLKDILKDKTASQINQILMRTFKQTWRLLIYQTELTHLYNDFRISSGKNYPNDFERYHDASKNHLLIPSSAHLEDQIRFTYSRKNN